MVTRNIQPSYPKPTEEKEKKKQKQKSDEKFLAHPSEQTQSDQKRKNNFVTRNVFIVIPEIRPSLPSFSCHF